MTPRLLALALVAAVGCSDPNDSPKPDAGAPDVGGDQGRPDGGPDAAADMAAPCAPVFLTPGAEPFQTLSEYCLFADLPGQVPAEGVVPFEPIAVLYADESLKDRFIAVPPGASIAFDADALWTFPEGTILVKTFYYHADARDPSLGKRVIETRLLVLREGVWDSYIYVWDDAQQDAHFERLGGWAEFDRVDEQGATVSVRYRIPNKNQCASCHEQNDAVVPLGPRAFQLNEPLDYGDPVGAKNQLQHWADLGILSGVPRDLAGQFTLTDYLDESADLDARARSYLEVNCAHCHNPAGAADPSGLKLGVTVTDPGEYGVCRRPVAAGAGSGGFFYDIVPGDPDASIMVFRMASVDPEIKMPELPTQTSDDYGVRLIREWIGAMTPAGCPDI